MINLNKTTKKASSFIHQYETSTSHVLRDIYKNYSWNKEKAYNSCMQRMTELHGHDFRLLSGNSFHFSCGYIIENDLIIETSCNTYRIKNYR